MEDRVLLSQTPTGLPTFSTTAQVGGTYDTNSYMGVTQAGFYSSNEYSAWGFLQYGSSSAIFGTDAGVSAVSSVSLSLYNSATSGNYAPVAGDFSVYVLPSSESTNATAFQSGVQYQNTSSGITSSLYGSPALGSGSYTSGPTSLGLPGTTDAANAPYLVGTWNATTFQTGYLTYTSTATTTNSPTGTTAVSAGFGSQVASTIATDLNNDLPIQLCVVAASSGFQEDWEGNYSGGDQPELSAAYTQVPRVSLSSPTYSVNETDQVAGHVTPLTFSVTDTPNPASTTSVIDWTATSTNIAAGNFSPTSGKLTFTNNASPQTGTIDFSNIVAAENSGQVTITLSVDHTDTAGTIIGPIGTATGTINYIQGTDVSISPSSDSVNESAGTVTLTVTRFRQHDRHNGDDRPLRDGQRHTVPVEQSGGAKRPCWPRLHRDLGHAVLGGGKHHPADDHRAAHRREYVRGHAVLHGDSVQPVHGHGDPAQCPEHHHDHRQHGHRQHRHRAGNARRLDPPNRLLRFGGR